MRDQEPFQTSDLADLNALFLRASAVVTMGEIAAGAATDVIGLRHDVDDNTGAFSTAVAMAQWEADRGFRATYFLLHTADYWRSPWFPAGLELIADGDHEIGLHANGLAEALRTGGNATEIIAEAVSELRSYGYPVRGVVAHGDALCGPARFVNDEMFQESTRPAYGAPDRVLTHEGVSVRLQPVSREVFGFDYDPNWLSRGMYLSDSGGRWSLPFAEVEAAFPYPAGQLHILQHPDWYVEAFTGEAIAA